MLLDKRLSGSLVSWSPISDRLLCACLVHKHGHLSVIVAYAPTQPSADADGGAFCRRLDSLVSAVPPRGTAVVLGDFGAVAGSGRHGFESVVGDCGSGRAGGGSARLLSLCAARSLSVLGSWFERRDVCRHGWICGGGHAGMELGRILAGGGSFFGSVRVFGGAGPPADSGRRLVVAAAALRPCGATGGSFGPRLGSALLMRSSGLADRCSVAVESAFGVLGGLPGDPGGVVGHTWCHTGHGCRGCSRRGSRASPLARGGGRGRRRPEEGGTT